MSKSVLISIKPKWCEMIASGKKTVEIRKTRPKIKPPFKCYIYCTKDPKLQFWTGPRYSYADDHSHNQFDRCGNGKVIGEFVCDAIEAYVYDYCTHPEIGKDYDCGDSWWEIGKEDLKRACMTYEQFKEYAMPNKDCMFGWHISNLSIYDEPQKIGAFRNICERTYCFETCRYLLSGRCQNGIHSDDRHITRPPQSWMYVEEE